MSQFHHGDLFADRYQFQQRLHSGGFSEVWSATDRLAHDAVVVVKLFAPEQGLTDAGLASFRRDAITVIPVEQSNLLKPLHFDVAANMPYVILPYCAHGAIADHMGKDSAHFSEVRLVQLLAEIGGALAYLQERVPPMLHAGLSPNDILITDDEHFLLADFWRSRDLVDTLAKHTGLPNRVNVAYAAPESFGAQPSLTSAGDIFALGMVVYQLASGVDPCSGNGGLALLRGVAVPDLPGEFSAEFRAIVLRCLAVNPQLRPSAQELAQWALAFLAARFLAARSTAGDSPQAPPLVTTGQSRDQAPLHTTHRQPVLLGALLVLLALGCLGVFVYVNLPKRNDAHSRAAEHINILLRLHGSNTIGSELAPLLAEEFLRKQGVYGIERKQLKPDELLVCAAKKGESSEQGIEIFAHGSSTAFEDLGKRVCDIGMASRRVKTEEQTALHDLGDMTAPACEHVLALDGIAIIVHQNNAMNEISKDTLAKIFSGDITNWSALGRSPGVIHVYARDDKSGTFDTFKNLVLGSKRQLLPGARRFESNEELRESVSNDPDGIGFASISFVKGVKALAVSDGSKAIAPSTFTVATEDYPLARRLFLYTPAQSANLKVLEFIEFALSKEGQELANRVGFVGQNVATVSVDRKDRLNFSFRFQSGSTQLDNKARKDIERLVGFLHDAKSSSRTVVLKGYTDNQGVTDTNIQLSRLRAEAVAAQLKTHGLTRVIVMGLGADNPVASNDSQDGRFRNRRVEVWLE